MTPPAYLGRIAGDSSATLHHDRASPRHCIAQLSAAVMTVHIPANTVGSLSVCGRRRADGAAGDCNPRRRSLKVDQMLAYRKPELRIETERAGMVAGLDQANACRLVVRRALQHVGHQGGADAPVLRARVDRDRSKPDDQPTLVDKVAADNLAVALGDYPAEP